MEQPEHNSPSEQAQENLMLRDQIGEMTVEALLAAERQLSIEQRMIEIEPRAEHFVYSYELISIMARVGNEIFPEQYANRASRVEMLTLAQQFLEGALASPGGYEHRESETELPRGLHVVLEEQAEDAGQQDPVEGHREHPP